ncbi:MAG TPA: hypothetical protein VNF99_17505 [Stellaceae bacterium]|nr:hypothetical protein [Stellaceae bacterium]
MAVIYVARSAALSKWASDVGLSKHVFKVGVADEPLKGSIAEGWAGTTDWALVKKEDAGALTEDAVLERLAQRETALDPKYYPRIRDARGLFKVNPVHVESHIIVGRALEGGAERDALKLKPGDFAAYLIHNAKR